MRIEANVSTALRRVLGVFGRFHEDGSAKFGKESKLQKDPKLWLLHRMDGATLRLESF